MVLSNLERQRRFRERQRAAAQDGSIPERTRQAIYRAVQALWVVGERNRDSEMPADPGPVEHWVDIPSFLKDLSSKKRLRSDGSPAEQLRSWFEAFVTDSAATDDERQALLLGANILRAGNLMPDLTKDEAAQY